MEFRWELINSGLGNPPEESNYTGNYRLLDEESTRRI
jgi:hypothetical protein